MVGGREMSSVGLAKAMSSSQLVKSKLQAAMQRRRNAPLESSSPGPDPSQSFTDFCNQRRIGYDKTFLWCCLVGQLTREDRASGTSVNASQVDCSGFVNFLLCLVL